MKVPTGYVLQESDYPEVPPKPGQLGRWKRYTDPIVQDITIHAEYGNPIPGAPTDPPSLMSTGEEPYSSGTAQPISTVTEEHSYIYASGMLLRETITSGSTTKTLDFRYDNVGYPYALIYNNGSTTATYYYITNLQGDVMYLVDSNGNQVAAYTYDPYGKILSATGTMAEINPLRYRGYYYDAETGFYYLQSRYYDPNTCRFINADSYASTDQGLIGYNMFAYCRNDPINRKDVNGNWSFWATLGVAIGAAVCIAAVTVLTCGVGTATLAGTIAVGAAKGALAGAAIGTATGAGIGYAETGTLEGAATGAAIGFGAGAVIGAAVGGTSAGLKFGTFSSKSSLANHFAKHGNEFGGMYSNAKEYANGAKYVIKNGTYIEEKNAYIRFLGEQGKANYAFVGLTSNGQVATYHVKSVGKMIKCGISLFM